VAASTFEGVKALLPGLRSGAVWLRVTLAVFVLAWLLGPPGLRSAVPIWLAFLIAFGLELQFFFGARRSIDPRERRSLRLPQAVDRERYGFPSDSDELLLVREHGEELWIPYAGETDEELDALITAARTRHALGEEPERLSRQAPEARVTRPRPYLGLLSGLAVIAVLGTLAWVADSHTGWSGLGKGTRAAAQIRFSAEAARIAGHAVTIRCDEQGAHVGSVQHADGIAEVGGTLAYLTPERCYDLYRLAFRDEVTFSRTARALAVLAHESWHLRGVRNEGRTECYALQSGVILGKRLGLSTKTADRMMRAQLIENSLLIGGESEYRIPTECREGGALDLAPERTSFP
jgi:hypothetical protein